MTLRPGKLPADMLAQLLGTIRHADPRVLLGPGIGRDAAVIDMGHGRVLVAKTDPVTFAADEIGWYAVNVNANDIACMGARPAWFMATALLPPGASDALPGEIFAQLTSTCSALGIQLVGGHTEVTIGLERPVVIGAMLGEAERDEIVLGDRVAEGDRIVLTKGIAIEGTALLARESAAQLIRAGVREMDVVRAAAMLHEPGISVVRDAGTVCEAVRPTMMHDPTEGGLSTALYELAEAAGATLRIDLEAVPVFDETRTVCGALGLDPMGLLASGALLCVVARGDAERAVEALEAVKIASRVIGTVERGPARVIIGAEDSTTTLARFARDEIARYYETVRA
jgi:hydrogenase expression/formation protein HypE